MSLLDKIKKNTTIKDSAILSKSKLFVDKDMIPTKIPVVNIALSGKLDGGLTPGLTMWAGPSKHFKTAFSLLMAKAYQDKYEDAVILFYDSEFGTPQNYFNSFGIDTDRVVHTPITDIEQLKFDIMAQLREINRGERVMIVIDSIGNLASKKEVEDALEQKSAADMTRAKQIKSLFRMVTPHLTLKDIPMVVVNHTYMEIGMFPKAIVGGGCVIAGTKIQLADGTCKSVEDFVVGDLVKTLNGPQEVTAIWNPETLDDGEPECYEIEFDDGHKVICSDKHKFLIPYVRDNGSGADWIEAKNMTVDMEVLSVEYEEIMKIKSITSVGKRKVYDLSVKEAEHYVLENGVVTHNTGSYYSADNIYILGRQQEKEGTEIVGYNFIINVEKSRYVREKAKIPVTVTFEGGISKWSGLLEMALESGHVVKPSNGWYSRVNTETGEVEDKKYRIADTDSKEFWEPILADETFKEWIAKTYQQNTGSIFKDEETESDDE